VSGDAESAGRRLKICIVSSVGGHLREVLQLLPALLGHDVFYILNDETSVHLDGRVYRIAHAERDLRVLLNFKEALPILRAERPDVNLSMGAGPAVPVAILGKLLGATIIFVENFGAVERPSLTGRIMYRLADHFFYQWESLSHFFPRGVHAGTVF
jgi:UDP-N-acetylglucosamine:LPS N-acetylglucosamine transferase